MRSVAFIGVSFALALGGARAGQAQPHPDPATYPGSITVQPGWFQASDLPYVRPGDAPTAAEMRAAKAFTERALEILRRDPAAASPRGYTVFAQPMVTTHAPGPNPTATFYFGLRVEIAGWYWDEYRKAMTPTADAGPFSIYANHIDCLFGEESQVGGDTAGTLYKEPRRTRDVTGAELYGPPLGGGRCAVLTNIRKPLWVPVSRDRYLRILIARGRDSHRVIAEAMRANSPKAQLKTHAKNPGQLGRDMREACESIRKVDASAYADCLSAAKSAQAQSDSIYRATAADPTLNASIAAADTLGRGMLRELESQLAALTPMERARPAVVWLDDRHDALPWSGLVRRGDTAAVDSLTTKIVVPNPDAFDRTVPRTAPQVITVETGTPYFSHTDEGIARYGQESLDRELKLAKRFRALLDALDWGALKALLRP